MRIVFLMCAGLLFGVGAARGETVQPATPIDRPIPEYPSAAGTVEGSVKLRFTIGKDGHVTAASVVESSPAGVFDATAIAGVRQWTFRPRLVDGKAVDQPDTAVLIRFKPPADAGPLWLNPAAPLYPKQAFQEKIEGKVTVGFDITNVGSTGNIHILGATPPGVFDAEAIEDVKQRIYQPPVVDGQPQALPGQTTAIDYKLAGARIRPKPTHIVKPVYPTAAEYARANGFCAMDLSIADDGSVSKAIIESAFPRGVFEDSCRSAVRRWKFETVAELGAPVADHIKYMINFRMEGSREADIHYLKPGQWIELEYTLTPEGRTKDVRVVGQSEPDVPTDKAIEQMKSMKFAPIFENGVAVEKQHLKIRIS